MAHIPTAARASSKLDGGGHSGFFENGEGFRDIAGFDQNYAAVVALCADDTARARREDEGIMQELMCGSHVTIDCAIAERWWF